MTLNLGRGVFREKYLINLSTSLFKIIFIMIFFKGCTLNLGQGMFLVNLGTQGSLLVINKPYYYLIPKLSSTLYCQNSAFHYQCRERKKRKERDGFGIESRHCSPHSSSRISNHSPKWFETGHRPINVISRGRSSRQERGH